MTETISQQWVLAKKPTGLPVLSGPDATFKLSSARLPSLSDNQVRLKVLYLSNDPAQRLWIDPNIHPDRLYTNPVEVGDKMASYAVAQVVQSRAPGLAVDILVSAPTGWCDYTSLPANTCTPIKSVEGLQPTESMVLFGVAGVTAWYGLVDIVHAGPKDAVVISGAAGAVGSIAVQIAKHVLGCRKVIGIAGSDAKCRYVELLGADACLNYKSATFDDDLRAAAGGFVEVYFDNVGGQILDTMLTLLQENGRLAACGAISEYNDASSRIKNWYHVIAMRLKISGFVVLDAISSGRWGAITDNLLRNYELGRLKMPNEVQTLVKSNFEGVPKTWMRLFSGESSGKLFTQLA